MTEKDSLSFERGSKAGFLIALGVVYGDIGTSPLYTMQALVRGQGGIGDRELSKRNKKNKGSHREKINSI